MGAVTMQDWHAEAVRLRNEEGKSERAIAKELGRAPSTIHAALSAHPQNGNGHHEEERPPAEPTPGQQTIDGGEVPAGDRGGPGRRDGPAWPDRLRRQEAADRDGHARRRAVRSRGGQAYSKGERLFFAGQAQVQAITGRDKLDTKTMIATSAVQHHAARIFELHVGDEEQILVGLFRQLVAADRQNAITIADAFVREANGGV
jgi:hypothetical protein